ncbi:MAG: dTMP kinase, partial [Candidatus Aenigmarchaeota archaeon]|nr:dTMP kinase [Candidatus Aenigmarchaeota archaeon]
EEKKLAKYIVLEGMDGSGKTTQAEILVKFLKENGFKVLLVTEPSKNPIGKLISEKLLKGGFSSEVISLAFAADRMLHFEETIKPALREYDFIISDRNFYSSLVYQPLYGSRYDWIKELNRYAVKPDLAFIIDVPIDVFMERRGETEVIFEKEDFQKKVRQGYLDLPNKLNDDFVIIDGARAVDEIHLDIRSVVLRL